MTFSPVSECERELCAIFDRCREELLGTLFFQLRNVDDAADALQDTFIKCWQHRETLPEIRNVRAWVFRVAINTARDRRGSAWHRRRETLNGAEQMLTSPDQSPESALLRDEELGRVRQAILQLDADEQDVFLLRQNGELTYEEIARSLNAPVGTVKTRMRSALRKLRAAVAD